MTPLTTPAEQLLFLGADFTRYNDALAEVQFHLYGPSPATTLAEQAETAQRMASTALDIVDTLASDQWNCSRVLRARVRQLAHLLLESADHLCDTVDLLDDTRAGIPVQGEGPVLSLQQARRSASIRLPRIQDLTLPGAEDTFAIAEQVAAEHRRRLPEHRPPVLSPTQDAAFRAVARGEVKLLGNKPQRYYADTYFTISTVRALEARGLVAREKHPRWFSDERVHLTADGCRALVAAFGRPRPPALTTTRPATMAPATAPAVGRSR
ncbi:hypothetical protein ACFVP0_10120 [Streptomyces cinereoruber]|uniref:hypothetical protein n=1 Tax=Streptomyces cinereoruber TaxID=67260 RepID=UPI00369312B4